MGIKGLWSVLIPYSEKKSLYEIRGETLAVDLSGWVCDSQNVTDYHIQPKLYLRTVYLLLADINPIFVLEGDAPELKRDVMAARNAIQFRGTAPKSDAAVNRRPDVGRKRFKNVLKECESLLKCMGIRCIKGRGEAEATCAELNSQGLVDAVVSQDSDCFAYGARRVYRNFSVSNAGGGGALQGSVDCYDVDEVTKAIGFGRNKMVALAMLCGCDYGVGACGSSISTTVAFLHTIDDSDVIPRLISWVSEPQKYEEMNRWASAPGRCGLCGHVGRNHVKKGCPTCGTHQECKDLGYKAKVSSVKRELTLRNRAVTCGQPFPEPKIMKEFMNNVSEKIDMNHLEPLAPSLIQFVKLMTKKLDWTEKYCVVKFLPLLTKWHLQDNVSCRTIKPIAIKKKRHPRGVPSFEVLWGDIDGLYEALIPDDQFEDDEQITSVWTTTERQDLMRKYHPKLVEEYEESIKKPPKQKKSRAKKNNSVSNTSQVKTKRKYTKKIKKIIDTEMENLSASIRNISISGKKNDDKNTSKVNVSVCVSKLKRKLNSCGKKGQQKTIDSFIAKKKRKSRKKSLNSVNSNFKYISDNYDNAFDEVLNSEEAFDDKENKSMINILDSTYGDDNDIDISDIIDNIVSRPPDIETVKINDNLVKLVFDKELGRKKSVLKNSGVMQFQNYCSTPNQSPIRRSSCFKVNKVDVSVDFKTNTSYFFDKLTEGQDAFELSLEYKHKSALFVNCDDTVDYSLPDVRL